MGWFSVLLLSLLFLGVVGGVVTVLCFSTAKPIIHTLLLDADGTLFDFDRAEQTALQVAFTAMGYPYTEETLPLYHEKNQACWKRLEQGEITRDELKVLRFRDTFQALGIEGDPEGIVPVYEGALGQCGFLYDGVVEAVMSLSKKYKLILVTNGIKAVQEPRLYQTPIPEYLDGIYISEDVGYAKPSPKFFDRVFADFPKLKRSQTMIVGDSLSGDIAGGINARIRTCWVNRNGDPRPEGLSIDLEVDDIKHLERALQ